MTSDATAPPLPEKRRLSRASQALVVLACLGLIVFGLWSLRTRTTPQDFYLREPTVESRRAFAAELDARAADASLSAHERHVLAIVAATHRYAAREGHLPKHLRELDLPEDLLDEPYRLVGSRAQWRLFGPANEVLARGN
jgi:hypothetical protein